MKQSSSLPSRDLILATGMRVTRQRIAVLDAINGAPHASAAGVLAAVTVVLPGVSHQAIYDCLTHLTEAGLLRRFLVDGGPALYETRTQDNHHHFVCRACGIVVDVDCATGTAPCLDLADAADFVIDEAEIIFRGLCTACATARPAPAHFPEPNPEEETVSG